MSEQFELFTDTRSIRERFEEFDRENPQVYVELRRLAIHAKRHGHRSGIKALFEVLRWSHGMKTKGDEFKLNNNFHSHYARALMEREPELAGFFETRKCRSKAA